MKKVNSTWDWMDDAMELVLKILTVFFVVLSIFLIVKGFIIICKCDMNLIDIFKMSSAQVKLRIMRNDELFIKAYGGFETVIYGTRFGMMAFAAFFCGRLYGAAIRIKHLYRDYFGEDFKVSLQVDD